MIGYSGKLEIQVSGKHYKVNAIPPLSCQVLSLGTHLLLIPNDASGGIRGGDNHSISLDIRDGAKVVFQASASQIVYGIASGIDEKSKARIETNIFVDSSSELQFRNRSTILCKDAHCISKTKIYLEADAGLFYQEKNHSGRIAIGESFQFAEYDSSLQLFYNDKLEISEHSKLKGRAENYESFPNSWGITLISSDAVSAEIEGKLLTKQNWDIAKGKLSAHVSGFRHISDLPLDQTNWNPLFNGYYQATEN